jgi:hypothetical protein
MIATSAEGISYRLVRQEDVAAHLSLPARWRASDLAEAAVKLHPDRPVYWADRSLAYAAAITAAADETV